MPFVSRPFFLLRRHYETPSVEPAFTERSVCTLKVPRGILLKGRRTLSFVQTLNGKRGGVCGFLSSIRSVTKHRFPLAYRVAREFLVCTNSANQGINRTFIQLARGASAQWLRPSPSFVGCIKACYPIR